MNISRTFDLTSEGLEQAKSQVLAHRGYAEKYPENTLEAIHASWLCGATNIEIDIQLTRDGVFVLSHDNDIKRMTGETAFITKSTYAVLAKSKFSQPGRFGGRFNHVSVATLVQALSYLAQRPALKLFIELKADSIEYAGTERLIAQLLPILEAYREQIVIISFHREFVLAIKRRTHFSFGWVIKRWDQDNLDFLKKLEPHYVFCNHKKLPKGLPRLPGGSKWVFYEVTDSEKTQALFDLGAAMIETMQVEKMISVVKENSGV